MHVLTQGLFSYNSRSFLIYDDTLRIIQARRPNTAKYNSTHFDVDMFEKVYLESTGNVVKQ